MRRISLVSHNISDYKYALLNGPGYTGVDPFYANEMLNNNEYDTGGRPSTGGPHLVQQHDGSYEFTPERHQLHNDIINHFLTHDNQGNPVQRQRQDQPKYTVLGGGPAAGKSTLINNGHLNAQMGDNPVYVDPDAIKNHIPEYNQMNSQGDPLGSTLSHYESSYVGRRLQKAAFEQGYNVVADGVGNGDIDDMKSKLDSAKSHGYQVNGAYATVPTDVAQQRAMDRGMQTGRFLPPSIISSYHAGVSKVLPQIAPHFDNLNLYDTTGDIPKPIMSASGGKMNVVDHQGYMNFLNKAGEDY